MAAVLQKRIKQVSVAFWGLFADIFGFVCLYEHDIWSNYRWRRKDVFLVFFLKKTYHMKPGCFLLRTEVVQQRAQTNWDEVAPNQDHTCLQMHTWTIPSAPTYIIHQELRKTRLRACEVMPGILKILKKKKSEKKRKGLFKNPNCTMCSVYLGLKCERLNLQWFARLSDLADCGRAAVSHGKFFSLTHIFFFGKC